MFLKLIFRATESQKRPKIDIFQKALFWILASSTNFVLTTISIVAEQFL